MAATAMRKISVNMASRTRQGHLVRRLLPLGAFHEMDHAVEEAFARIGGGANGEESEISKVPAVTDENVSVPGSFITGADSPVMADFIHIVRRQVGAEGVVMVLEAVYEQDFLPC